MDEETWKLTEAEKRKRNRSRKRAFQRWHKMNYYMNSRSPIIREYLREHSSPALQFAMIRYSIIRSMKHNEYHKKCTRNWMKNNYQKQKTNSFDNEKKGKFLEKAMSEALNVLGVPHEHNPFDNNYSVYTGKMGDILLPELDLIIECKNLSYWSSRYVNKIWLNREVIQREGTEKYRFRIILMSYPLSKNMHDYVRIRGWKMFVVGYQVLPRNQSDAIRLLVRKFLWLSKKYKSLR